MWKSFKIIFKYKLLIGFSIIFFSFFLSRFGIWCDFMVPLIFSDGIEYLIVAQDIMELKPPSFHFIGGGYPVILVFCKIISNSGYSIILFQQFLSLFSISLLFYFTRNIKGLFIPMLLFSVLYISFDNTLKWEISVFPDSILSNLLILLVGLTYKVFQSKRHIFPIAISIIVFYAIFIRSSSIFLFVFLFILCAILFLTKEYKKMWLSLLPSLVLFLILGFYNFTFSYGHKFSILTYGRTEQNEDKELYIEKEKNKLNYTHKEKAELILRKIPKNEMFWKYKFSWNPHQISEGNIHCRYENEIKELNGYLFLCSKGNFSDTSAIILNKYTKNESEKKILLEYDCNAIDLIGRIRLLYAFQHNYYYNAYGKTYYGVIENAHKTSILKNNIFINSMDSITNRNTLIFALGRLYNKENIEFSEKNKNLTKSFIFRLYDLYQNNIEDNLFRNSIWLYFAIVSVIYSCVQIGKRKTVSDSDILILTSFILHIGSSLIFTFIVPNPLPRYSFNTEFFIYFSSLIFLGSIITNFTKCFKMK
jgi:hypothetical protein